MAMFSFDQFQILTALWTVKVKWGPNGVPRQERVKTALREKIARALHSTGPSFEDALMESRSEAKALH